MEQIPKKFRKMATAITITKPPPFRQDEEGKPQHSGFYLVQIQNGWELFGQSEFWIQNGQAFFVGDPNRGIPGARKQFSSSFSKACWPKVILDDGGWLAWVRDQAQPSFKDEESLVAHLVKMGKDEGEFRGMLLELHNHFLSAKEGAQS